MLQGMSRLIHRIIAATLLAGMPVALHAETECVALFDRLDQIEMLGGQASGEEDLENARAMYESLGCANIATDPACRDLSAQIRSMQAAGLGNSNIAKERRQIMARLRAGGCMSGEGRSEWDRATEGAQNPKIFDDLYRESGGENVWRSGPKDNADVNDDTINIPAQGGGRYRTLCVRSCDGYYWPISFSANSGNFARDQQMCAASCPNQEVSLYVHRPAEQSEEARSLQGEPYAALANAFVYRKRYVKECSCQAQMQQVEVVSGPSLKSDEPPPVETYEQKLNPLNPPPAVQDNEEPDVYRSVPVIIGPNSNGAEKSTQPNGLRGVSP